MKMKLRLALVASGTLAFSSFAGPVAFKDSSIVLPTYAPGRYDEAHEVLEFSALPLGMEEIE